MEGVVILLACAVYTAYGSSSFISTAENNITDAAIVWMELLCGPDGVYVCPGGGDQDGRPGGKGDDRAVRAKKLAVEEPKSWLFKVKKLAVSELRIQ